MTIKLTEAMLNRLIDETILEVKQEHTLLQGLRTKLRKWLETLSPEEQAIIRSTFRKKSAMEMLQWCGAASDRLSGKWDNEEFNRRKEIAKLNKKK